MSVPKILLLDLETFGFDFKADKGFILCGSYKWLSGGPDAKVHTIVRENISNNMWNDKTVCRKLGDIVNQADMLVTHNGKRFDVPFLNTRLLKHGLSPMAPVPHFDTCEVIWKRLKMRGRLESAQKFFGFKHSKTDLNLETWAKAGTGNTVALNYVVKHCEADIRVLEETYLKLRPLGFKHPNVAVLKGDNRVCPICGKHNTSQQRGIRVGQVNSAIRFHCTKDLGGCGTWYSGRYQSTGIKVRP